jgi:hypothetical protein
MAKRPNATRKTFIFALLPERWRETTPKLPMDGRCTPINRKVYVYGF